jgi:conjugative transposon TraK protein
MFQKFKNIDVAFRHIRLFSFLFMGACFILSLYVLYSSYTIIARANQKIYVLSNGKALEAVAADRKDNIPVEARDHVRIFHQYFFTLDPDEKVIQGNIVKALYLADRSAKEQYDNLKENSYYANIISGNISQELIIDSIRVNIETDPYYFLLYGKQKIIRPSSLVIRSLITEGYLRNVSRSDNNPHGFLIEKWKILQNRDLKIENR